MLKRAILITLCLGLLQSGHLAARSLGGTCSNWMTMGLNSEAGQIDDATTRSSCTALGKDNDFVTFFEDRTSTCLICALADWTPVAAHPTRIVAGTYEDKGGWGTVILTASGSTLTGTYTGAYEADTGNITFFLDGNGTYRGEWSEPEIGRSGILENITLAKDGKSFTADWRSTVAGDRRHASGHSRFNLRN